MESIRRDNVFVRSWKKFQKQDIFIKTSIISLVVLIVAASTSTAFLSRASGGAIFTVTPVADSYIVRSSPDNNNGSDKFLKSDKERMAYLKFNLIPFAGQSLTNAKLRIYVTNDSSTKQNIKNVIEPNWVEDKISYSKRPARESKVIASITNTKNGQWKEIDLTKEAQSHLGQMWSIAIDNPSGSDDSMYFYSKEQSSYKPQLVLQFTSSTLLSPTQSQVTNTPIPSPTIFLPTTRPSLSPSAKPTTIIPSPTLVFTPTRPVTSGTLPSQVLNLTNWKETLPIGSAGSPTEIKQPQLATYQLSPWFDVPVAGGGVRFRAPVNGVTTGGSSYPRSELREMTNNGTANASWSSTAGTHTFFIDEAITAVPQTKKHVVAGQIHDANDDVIVIRLEYPKLFVDINGATGPILDPSYVLGKRFVIKFVVTGGKTNIYYNNSVNPVYTLTKNYSGAYFKVGAYTQSNCTKEPAALCNANNYGEVMVYQATVTHQ